MGLSLHFSIGFDREENVSPASVRVGAVVRRPWPGLLRRGVQDSDRRVLRVSATRSPFCPLRSAWYGCAIYISCASGAEAFETGCPKSGTQGWFPVSGPPASYSSAAV